LDLPLNMVEEYEKVAGVFFKLNFTPFGLWLGGHHIQKEGKDTVSNTQ
jgi:hypothetical protein